MYTKISGIRPEFFNYLANRVSGRIVKSTIWCTPTSDSHQSPRIRLSNEKHRSTWALTRNGIFTGGKMFFWVHRQRMKKCSAKTQRFLRHSARETSFTPRIPHYHLPFKKVKGTVLFKKCKKLKTLLQSLHQIYNGYDQEYCTVASSVWL